MGSGVPAPDLAARTIGFHSSQKEAVLSLFFVKLCPQLLAIVEAHALLNAQCLQYLGQRLRRFVFHVKSFQF